MAGSKLIRSGLSLVYDYFANLSKKLAKGEELAPHERQDYLNYLKSTRDKPEFRDVPPGFTSNPLEFGENTRLYRGSNLEDLGDGIPAFTFMDSPLPALSYAFTSPGSPPASVTKLLAPSANPARLNDMLGTLLEDPRLLNKVLPEVEYGIDSDIVDMSGLQDYLYSDTLRKKLGKQGFNSMLSWEDSFYHPGLVPGFIGLERELLKPLSRHQVVVPEMADQFRDAGYNVKKFTDDFYKVGREQRPGESFRKKAEGGLAQIKGVR